MRSALVFYAVQVIHEAEADLEIAKIDLEKSRDLFSSLRLQLRDKQMEGVGNLIYTMFEQCFHNQMRYALKVVYLHNSVLVDKREDGDDDLPGLKIAVRELDDVLLRDVGDRIKDSGKYVCFLFYPLYLTVR